MKVKALLRRVEMDRGKTAAAEDELHYGDIRYSATENAVFCGSTIVALPQTELRLLSYMTVSYTHLSVIRRMDAWLEEANCRSRSEFIEKAVRFYMGYLGDVYKRQALHRADPA